MKFNKLVLSGLLAATLASTASAQIQLHMYGSTAYRKATYVAIGALFGANPVTVFYDSNGDVRATTTDKTSASAALGSTNLTWNGTIASGTLSGQAVVIYCNWAGSVGGVKSVAQNVQTPVTFYIDPANNTAGVFLTANADVAMSDAYQNETPFASFVPGNQLLTHKEVSVLEFIWAKNANAQAGVTNMTPWTARSAFLNGSISLAQFTGLDADAAKPVLLTGRDSDSGTRIVAQLDSTWDPTQAVIQYSIDSANSINYFGVGADSLGGGYSSGGSVRTALQTSLGATPTITDQNGTVTTPANVSVIGYISVTDATKAILAASVTPSGERTIADFDFSGASTVASSQWLTYNGATFSEPAINNGAYSYWSQEHLFYRTGAVANVKNFGNDLSTEQKNQAGAKFVPGTEPVTKLLISRSLDGQDITHN